MSTHALRAVFVSGYRLRAGWRIALFLVLFAALAGVGALGGAWLNGRFPAAGVDWIGTTVGLIAALGAGWIVLGTVDGRPAGALGFAWNRGAVAESAWGFGIGAALIGMAALALAVSGDARWVPQGGTGTEYLRTLLTGALFFAVAAALEEAVFRGYPFQALVEGIGTVPAVGVSSLLFALAHLGNPNVGPVALLNIFLAGVLLAVAYLRTRSLWFATGIHLGWNWTMAALLDFPVSGLRWDTPLYDVVERGSALWTGGAFGPEAGLAATATLAVGTGWLLRSPRVRESVRMRALRPLVDGRLAPSAP